MSTRLKALREAAEGAAKAARDIAEKAESESREMTDAEKVAFNAELTKGKDLVEKVKAARADDDLTREVLDMADAIGPAGPSDELARKSGRLPLTGDGVKSLARNLTRASYDTERKALVSSGARITSLPLRSGVVEMGKLPQSILDVIDSEVTQPQFSFLRQTVRTNNAAPVAEGATKPTSIYSIETVDSKLTVIAHVSEQIPEYTLKDNRNLEQFMEVEMLYGLRNAIETQVLSGNGTEPNMRGILNTSGIQVQAFATDKLTTFRKAITKIETTGYTASSLVVRPEDWEAIELLTATSGATDVQGLPVNTAARRLWGVQAVVSNALPEDTALLLDQTALALTGDAQYELKWTDAISDDFLKNYVRARLEGRYGLAVYKPMGIVRVDTAAS
ncbi:phage major capsid protein [Gordonia sp. SID5947]|uniref:phage major capsid protein n=1 Tax=Gordonia sp. SID5947 TaxID=2690315 RepID=UPI00136DF769|nr:phage major capsid protein [Gordonia sp. SID5947]MYR07453.1 phage major capsid protein [Gordonia sp. SID5947]